MILPFFHDKWKVFFNHQNYSSHLVTPFVTYHPGSDPGWGNWNSQVRSAASHAHSEYSPFDSVILRICAHAPPHRNIDGFHAAGVQTTGQTFKTFCKIFQKCGISWPYLESPWKMHSNKYQHAKYWFSNSWNNLWNFRIFRKRKQFCSVKPMPAF